MQAPEPQNLSPNLGPHDRTALAGEPGELVVGAVEETAHVFGMNEVFVGVILVAQIALFVAPVLVLLQLRFTTLEVVAVGISVWIMPLVAQDGGSHWMEGVQPLAV